jgi:FGFR1 oncogene partner
VLGQVRAQLRSCVFKVIDNQDQVEQKRSSFHWENPHAKKMRADTQSSLAAEVIREFMEFYRLDYSLAIFGPEANLKG